MAARQARHQPRFNGTATPAISALVSGREQHPDEPTSDDRSG
jgi:hypothetical protein